MLYLYHQEGVNTKEVNNMKYVVYLEGNFRYEFESEKDDLTREEIAFEMGVHPDEIEHIILMDLERCDI